MVTTPDEAQLQISGSEVTQQEQTAAKVKNSKRMNATRGAAGRRGREKREN
jgi:hypothetical protein